MQRKIAKNSLKTDILGVQGSRSPLYERIKFAYTLENVRFLLLSTNLAGEWLQIDTDLLPTSNVLYSLAISFSFSTK